MVNRLYLFPHFVQFLIFLWLSHKKILRYILRIVELHMNYFDFDAMRFLRNSSPSTVSPRSYSSIAISNLVFFFCVISYHRDIIYDYAENQILFLHPYFPHSFLSEGWYCLAFCLVGYRWSSGSDTASVVSEWDDLESLEIGESLVQWLHDW